MRAILLARAQPRSRLRGADRAYAYCDRGEEWPQPRYSARPGGLHRCVHVFAQASRGGRRDSGRGVSAQTGRALGDAVNAFTAFVVEDAACRSTCSQHTANSVRSEGVGARCDVPLPSGKAGARSAKKGGGFMPDNGVRVVARIVARLGKEDELRALLDRKSTRLN